MSQSNIVYKTSAIKFNEGTINIYVYLLEDAGIIKVSQIDIMRDFSYDLIPLSGFLKFVNGEFKLAYGSGSRSEIMDNEFCELIVREVLSIQEAVQAENIQDTQD